MSRDEKFQFAGWVLFVVCALFYAAASIESRSLTSFIGSVLFLVACFVFLVPLVRK
jgi:hypothetical protein